MNQYQQIFIAGCGYVGKRLATAMNKRPICLVRSEQSARICRADGLETVICDLDQEASVDLPLADTVVIYLIPPPGTGQTDPRMKHFLQSMTPDNTPRRIIYLGTTGVYGDCQGAWVDESRAPAPQADRAKRRLDAEQQLHQWQLQNSREIVLLRVAGIYGPDKLPMERLQQNKPMISAEQAPWTNRIHVDDLVQACVAAITRGRNGAVYNLSDGQPAKMTDYFNMVADFTGLPRPPIIAASAAGEKLTAGMQSYLAESRRIDNRRMLEELGITLKYPSLSAGLQQITGQ